MGTLTLVHLDTPVLLDNTMFEEDEFFMIAVLGMQVFALSHLLTMWRQGRVCSVQSFRVRHEAFILPFTHHVEARTFVKHAFLSCTA